MKISVKKKLAWFVYEHIITRFGIHLEMVSDNEPQFTSDVWEDLMEWFAIKHWFKTYVQTEYQWASRANEQDVVSYVENETETRANANNWNLRTRHVKWVYNSTFKTATKFSFLFSLWHWGFVSDRTRTHDPSHCY